MRFLWNDTVTWEALEGRLRDEGVRAVQVKYLSRNHNAKNQITGLGNDLAVLGHLYPGPVTARPAASEKPKAGGFIYATVLPWVWLTHTGVSPAPGTKLIYYPQYPEIRLSGFLDASPDAPSQLIGSPDSHNSRSQEEGRVLVFGPGKNRQVFAAVLSSQSPAAKYLGQFRGNRGRLAQVLIQSKAATSREVLFSELRLIHDQGWFPSRRLRADGSSEPCRGTNCHGVTLETELGISPNSRAAPDYLDWEVKAHSVKHLNNHLSSNITLMTPNPDSGLVKRLGASWLASTYGRINDAGVRYDLTGQYRAGVIHPSSKLQFDIEGFSAETGKIVADGFLVLRDPIRDESVAQWSFSKLLTHWQTKHAQAVFVPSVKRVGPPDQFRYGTHVHVGTGTSFVRFLAGIATGAVVLDPGLNTQKDGGVWRPHTRYQFRCPLTKAPALYHAFEKSTL